MASGQKKNQNNAKRVRGNNRSLGEVSKPELSSQVEYEKTATSFFQVPLNDISERHKNNYVSYDINMILPGQDVLDGPNYEKMQDGVIARLGHSEYTVENTSPYTLYFRMQRPLGYVGDPAALAMWEPVLHRQGAEGGLMVPVRPQQTRVFKLSNASTNMVVPRQTVIDGRGCVHLLSMSVYRDVLSNYGTNAIPTNENGFVVSIRTYFQSNDGKIGSLPSYIIETYNGDTRMNEINSGPPSSVRVADLRSTKGTVDYIQFKDDGQGYSAEFLTLTGGKISSAENNIDGLDKNTYYRVVGGAYICDVIDLSTKKRVRTLADVMGHIVTPDGGHWSIGVFVDDRDKADGALPNIQWLRAYKVEGEGFYNPKYHTLPSSCLLVPVLNKKDSTKICSLSTKKTIARISYSLKPRATVSSQYGDGYDESLIQTILDGLTVIIKVLTVTSTIVGYIGAVLIEPPGDIPKPTLNSLQAE